MKQKTLMRIPPATLIENTRVPSRSGKLSKPEVTYDEKLADTWAYGYSIPEGPYKANEEITTLVIEKLREARKGTEEEPAEPRHNVLHLDSLKVAKKAPPGTGTAIVNQLCAFADKHDITITLSLAGKEDFKNQPQWKQTTSTRRLEKFYRRFGFKKNVVKGRFELKGSLHREPKKS
jgi:hypothetical protein